MPVVTSIQELLRTLPAVSLDLASKRGERIVSGLEAIDGLFSQSGLQAGAVHEVLSSARLPATLWPVVLARAAATDRWVVWSDPARRFYPPAAAALGLPLDRLLVLQPKNASDEIWAVAECLRCTGVGACVAALGRLSRVQVRRLQLAAEKGGGIGILLRPAEAIHWPYAAATRWKVRPAPGERTLQRCHIELIHGHGGRVGQGVLLEVCRETHHVRATSAMAHRQDTTTPAVASA